MATVVIHTEVWRTIEVPDDHLVALVTDQSGPGHAPKHPDETLQAYLQRVRPFASTCKTLLADADRETSDPRDWDMRLTEVDGKQV